MYRNYTLHISIRKILVCFQIYITHCIFTSCKLMLPLKSYVCGGLSKESDMIKTKNITGALYKRTATGNLRCILI